MLSKKDGRAFAKIAPGKGKVLYINENEGINEISLSRGEKLEPLPNIDTRECVYIAGPSGSGKSTYAATYIKNFLKIFDNMDFYIFSRKDHDDALDKLNPIRINIDESLVTDPIDITKDLEGGAIVLFDDVNTIQDDKIRKAVNNLMADIMEVGRSFNVYIVITNHLVIPNEKKIARTILNECHSLTVFPKSGTSQQINYALKTYFGLSKKQIEEILHLPSRWVTICKGYPQYVFYETGAYIL
jgi:hypothetical protein